MTTKKVKRGLLNAKESLILAALRNDHRPHSAYELIDKLRDGGTVAPATVYRALHRLIEIGHVHRLESLNAYVACTHGQCQEHSSTMFAICNECGNVEELADPSVTAPAVKWAKANTFVLNSITFELRGICESCRETGAQSHA